MGEYEPDDSRDVTLSDHQAPGEPPRTGPREGEARAAAADTKADGSTRTGSDADPVDATGGRPVDEDALAKDAEDAARAQPSADRTGGA